MHLAPREDPRIERTKLHALSDIMLLTVGAGVRGADGGEAIEDFGREKLQWLRQCTPFQNRVPSPDCMVNVIAPLSPKRFQECLRHGTQAVATAPGGAGIAVDGEDRERRTRSRQPLPRFC
jgi:hypothetical protein